MLLLIATTSGLAGLADEVREFFAAVRFARPSLLLLLLLLPVLGLLDRWATRRRRTDITRIGRPATVAGQLTHPVIRHRWLGLAYPLAWVLLILGIAGPRWGKSDEKGVAVGRDLIIVIDLSRSMLADDVNAPAGGWQIPDLSATEAEVASARKSGDQTWLAAAEDRLKELRRQKHEPTRWRAAREGALDLLTGVARRGGHRVGIVVFAARPLLLCPLTTDYDHVRAVLEELDSTHPPPEIRPGASGALSGTRIGEALKLAVNAHDKRFPGFQDIVLISDGDDPGEADREWREGSRLASDRKIPIHTAGVGNPNAPTVLVLGEELVNTQLQEGVVKEIAEESGGEYATRGQNPRDTPQLGEFFRSQLEGLPTREVSDESLPLPRERYPWVLGPALALFLIGWLRGR